MKIQKEMSLRAEALAAIIKQHEERKQPGTQVSVVFAGFGHKRRIIPKDDAKDIQFILVYDESPEDDGYASYQGFDSIAPDIPEPTTHSPVKNGSAKQRKNTPPTEE